jgi:transcriptional regulator with XRE-family HTH domain
VPENVPLGCNISTSHPKDDWLDEGMSYISSNIFYEQPLVAKVQGVIDSIATMSPLKFGMIINGGANMKLQEKILYYRKKSGLSQEALAEKLGVSRQAVSKWETGEAVPEIGKILLLAKTFGITTDSLLNDDEPVVDTSVSYDFDKTESGGNTWVDSIPGVLGKLLRRYGWLFGVYMAVAGFFFILIGSGARLISKRMFSGFVDNVLPQDQFFFDQTASLPGFEIMTSNPVSIMGSVVIVIGVILLVAGVVLAIVLKKLSKEKV